MTWGVNGAGGTDTWDITTSNWFNGTGNVTWDSQTAIFGGSPGTVSLSASGPITASQLIFNTAGYVISGNILASPSGSAFNVTTNADATINSTVEPLTFASANGDSLVKNGPGTLTLSGQFSDYGVIQINDGNLDFTSTSTVTNQGTTVTLANTPLAALTIGNNTFKLGGLNGGGSAGGVVRPESSVSVALTFNSGSGSYAGSLQDNGTGILSIATLNTPTQTFTGVNTYSGSTQIVNGTFTFAGLGSASNTSAISVSSAGSLILDNSGTNVGNRLSDLAAITLSGELIYRGNNSAPSSETAGALLTGAVSTTHVTVIPDAAQPSSITFASISQVSASTAGLLVFRGANLGAVPAAGTANVLATTAPALIGGGGAAGSMNISILPFALGDFSPVGSGTSFVTYGVYGIRPLADAEYALNNFSAAGANVNVDGNSFASTISVNSLRLKNGANVSGDGMLTVASGAILSLLGNSNIRTPQLNFGTKPITLEIQGTTTITSAIAGTDKSHGLTKLGAGRLVLTGTNTYAGQTRIAEGILNMQANFALGSASAGTMVETGAALELQGGINVGSETLTLNGTRKDFPTSVYYTGDLRSISGENVWGGSVTGFQMVVGVDAGSLSLPGIVTITAGLAKVGNGSLVLSRINSSFGGSLDLGAGRLIFTANSGNPIRLGLNLSNGVLSMTPTGSGGTIGFGASSATYVGDCAIELNKGANNSLGLGFSSLTRKSSGSSLVVIPGSGLSALGLSEKLGISMTNTNGIVPTSVVGRDNDANLSGTFLTYDVTNGLLPATYSANTDLNVANSTTIFKANGNQTLTASRNVYALQNNGQTIDLGAKVLQVGINSNLQDQGGIILNGGTIQNGTLYFPNPEGTIYTSRAGGTISSTIESSGLLMLFGPGKLTLSGSNSYFGMTYVNGGTLNLQGTLNSTLRLSPTAMVTGTGTSASDIGGGTISPGDGGAGILTAQFINVREPGIAFQAPYTNLAFEFTKLGLPNFGSATGSGNDVLRLTKIGTGIFGSSLVGNNEIDLYFNTGFALQEGQIYSGGFFTDNNAAFDSSILGATYKVFVGDPLGTTVFNGVSYSGFDAGQIVVSSVPQAADFGSGTVNGYIMQVQIVPEPASLELLGAVAAFGLLRRYRRS